MGVNTKYTIYQSCQYIVNFVFTPTQLIQNLQYDIKVRKDICKARSVERIFENDSISVAVVIVIMPISVAIRKEARCILPWCSR